MGTFSESSICSTRRGIRVVFDATTSHSLGQSRQNFELKRIFWRYAVSQEARIQSEKTETRYVAFFLRNVVFSKVSVFVVVFLNSSVSFLEI